MNNALPNLQPSTENALKQWHQFVDTGDLNVLNKLLDDSVIFKSPMAHRPYSGKAAASLILSTVITIFQNFTYHRSFVSSDGLQVVLEFSAEVDGKSLKGIDMIAFNDNGKIVDFEVMIRPFNGLAALGKEWVQGLVNNLNLAN